jgi:lipopolysaccharide transport system ATP-binding protein
MKPAIRIETLGKSYRISHEAAVGYRTLRETLRDVAATPVRRLRGIPRQSVEEFWAIRDVSFDVPAGEVLGVIGRNGAGKSTLLKVLSRITKPSTGRAILNGRIGSLLEVGTGFHPELTGKENIYLNGSILGMTRKEIQRQFGAIVDFSGIEKFLDTPIKRYSSGMYVRLAFAVAAHLEPEILLVDEVLAVGDQAFQKKCVGRMSEIASSGRTIVLVSHDLPMLSRLCTSAVWLEKGGLAAQGATGDVIKSYCESASDTEWSHTVFLCDHPNRRPGSKRLMQRLSLFDGNHRPSVTVPLGGTLVLELDIDEFVGHLDTTIIYNVCDMFGTSMAEAHSKVQAALDLTGLRSAKVRCLIDDVRLVPGDYSLTVRIGDSSDALDRIENAIRFSVSPADIYGTGKVPKRRDGLFALTAKWELDQNDSVGKVSPANVGAWGSQA